MSAAENLSLINKAKYLVFNSLKIHISIEDLLLQSPSTLICLHHIQYIHSSLIVKQMASRKPQKFTKSMKTSCLNSMWVHCLLYFFQTIASFNRGAYWSPRGYTNHTYLFGFTDQFHIFHEQMIEMSMLQREILIKCDWATFLIRNLKAGVIPMFISMKGVIFHKTMKVIFPQTNFENSSNTHFMIVLAI